MSINLLLWRENRQKTQFKIHLLLLILCWIFIDFSIGGIKHYLNFSKNKYERRNQSLTEKIQRTQINQDFQQLQNEFQLRLQQLNYFNEINNQKKNFWQVVGVLQSHLPNGIQLDHITWQKLGFQLQGNAITSDKINSMMNLLEKIALFKNVTLNNIHLNEQSKLIQFLIQAELHDFKHEL